MDNYYKLLPESSRSSVSRSQELLLLQESEERDSRYTDIFTLPKRYVLSDDRKILNEDYNQRIPSADISGLLPKASAACTSSSSSPKYPPRRPIQRSLFASEKDLIPISALKINSQPLSSAAFPASIASSEAWKNASLLPTKNTDEASLPLSKSILSLASLTSMFQNTIHFVRSWRYWSQAPAVEEETSTCTRQQPKNTGSGSTILDLNLVQFYAEEELNTGCTSECDSDSDFSSSCESSRFSGGSDSDDEEEEEEVCALLLHDIPSAFPPLDGDALDTFSPGSYIRRPVICSNENDSQAFSPSKAPFCIGSACIPRALSLDSISTFQTDDQLQQVVPMALRLSLSSDHIRTGPLCTSALENRVLFGERNARYL